MFLTLRTSKAESVITIQELYQIYLQHSSVQTDTRRLQKGDLFFALKGSNFNGNLFALQALEQGAAYAVIDEAPKAENERLIFVADVLETLQQLAKHHREQFSIPFIAITGSNGKTTTKELVYAVLSSHFKTYTTKGNLNNHIGIPLTLLQVKTDAEIAVIEMGANHLHEIAGYCLYTQPTHAIITNAGKAHLEGFGSMEGVRKGKGELYDYIRETKGSIFAFDDYDYLHQMSHNINSIYWYGTKHGEVTGIAKEENSFVEVTFTNGFSLSPLQTQLVGNYNLPNILCAVAVGKYFNVPEEKIKRAIENYAPSNSRSQLVEKNGNKIILDAYNANPSSMKAAIENFANLKADNKILMLGSMAELGDDSLAEHQQLVDLIKELGFINVVLVGKYFNDIPHPYLQFANTGEAKEWLKNQNIVDSYILIKGSRSMQMETVVD
jgi:UDP-N-acetylmuramoyl-tripeptide--D-alanyl-D-alanine ligase